MKTEPLLELPEISPFSKGDVLLLIGELFGRGYANGIVEAAKKRGMSVLGTTVGRRDKDGALRCLTDEELSEAQNNLGGEIINIPLEAGFDMEPSSDGNSPCERLKTVKPDNWNAPLFSEGFLESSRSSASARFRVHLKAALKEATSIIPAGSKLLIVHAMAGGVPRARVFMPLLNRIFKGRGDKYLSSEDFWKSDLGKLCSMNFEEVTAETFRILIEESQEIRSGRDVRYAAYGYHGTRILIEKEYKWQTYTPYLQGWAKMKLEEHAADSRKSGVVATVFNSPEIQTNSSALFLGVEVSLYPFIKSLRACGGEYAAEIEAKAAELLSEGCTIDNLLELSDKYQTNPLISQFHDFDKWPLHSTKEEMECMLETSDIIMTKNRNSKEPVCALLSQSVFKGVGELMLDASWSSDKPALWLDHDIIAKRLCNNN